MDMGSPRHAGRNGYALLVSVDGHDSDQISSLLSGRL